MTYRPGFINCEKCGKRLIELKPNGVWYFSFGRPHEEGAVAPVEMMISGFVKIKCIRRSCGHWNELNLIEGAYGTDEC